MEADGWPKEFEVIPGWARLARIAGHVGSFIKQVAYPVYDYHSSHYEHPLDAPIEPVVGWPPAQRWPEAAQQESATN